MRTLFPLLLTACTWGTPQAPSPAPAGVPADDPADDATADPAEVDAAPAEPGILTEAGFKALHTKTATPAPPARGETITLSDGSQAYLALPEGAEAPMPGVVVIHEWWGLNDHIRHWADRLASDGYAAVAVDLYGGEEAQDADQAMALMKAVDPEKARATLAAAHTFLRRDTRVLAPRTGSIGWCFGGGWSLRLATATPELDAAVIYYGRAPGEAEALGELRAPILGHFGVEDQGIPREAVQAFHDAVKAHGTPVTIHMYDAGHAFANPSGKAYDPEPAEAAWERTRAFLGHHVKGGG